MTTVTPESQKHQSLLTSFDAAEQIDDPWCLCSGLSVDIEVIVAGCCGIFHQLSQRVVECLFVEAYLLGYQYLETNLDFEM